MSTAAQKEVNVLEFLDRNGLKWCPERLEYTPDPGPPPTNPTEQWEEYLAWKEHRKKCALRLVYTKAHHGEKIFLDHPDLVEELQERYSTRTAQ